MKIVRRIAETKIGWMVLCEALDVDPNARLLEYRTAEFGISDHEDTNWLHNPFIEEEERKRDSDPEYRKKMMVETQKLFPPECLEIDYDRLR